MIRDVATAQTVLDFRSALGLRNSLTPHRSSYDEKTGHGKVVVSPVYIRPFNNPSGYSPLCVVVSYISYVYLGRENVRVIGDQG